MIKSFLRLRVLLAALLICLLLPAGASAAQGASQVYVAVDRANMLPLAGALSYLEEQSGANVNMVNIFLASSFYSTGNVKTVQEAVESFQGRNLSDSNKISHMCTFLTSFADDMDFSAESVRVYILSGYERDEMIFGTWDEATEKFRQNQIQRAYAALCELLDENPAVELHFCFMTSKEPGNKTALDQKLQERFPGRVRFDVVPEETSDYAFISQMLADAMPPAAARTLSAPLDAQGSIPYSAAGTSELLGLTFDSGVPPLSVRFVPEGSEASLGGDETVANAQTEAADGAIDAYHDTDNHIFWLYLPEGVQGGSIVISYESGIPEDVTYRLDTWAALPEAEFFLLDAQGKPVTGEEPISLFSEETQWTLTLALPGFTIADVTPSLTAVLDSGSGPALQAAALTGSAAQSDGSCTWTFVMPPLGPDAKGSLCMQYTVWDQATSEEIRFPFAAENRAPMLAEGIEAPVVLDVYYDVPGVSAPVMTFNLSAYFSEPDGLDSLSMTDHSGTQHADYTYSISGGVMTYEARRQTGNPTKVFVTATDQSGAAVECEFHVVHHSVLTLLKQLRMLPSEETAACMSENRFILPINEEAVLTFVLPAEQLTQIRKAFMAFGLPALEECLKIDVNGEPVTLTVQDNGDLAFSFNQPAVTSMTTIPLALSARLAYTPGGAAPAAPSVTELPDLFGAAQIEISIQNNPPRLRDEEAAFDAGAVDIGGMPGGYEPVNFSDHFGEITLSELFVNDEETEPLTYTLHVTGGDIALYAGASVPLAPAADGVYTLSGEAADAPLHIQFLTPGDVHIEIAAQDTASSSPSVSYSIRLNSSFMRTLIIVLIIAVVIIIAVVAALIIRRRLKPTFDGSFADISYARTEAMDPWQNADSYTTMRLDHYGKDAVSLMALLVACGHLPPRNCSPEALTHITFAPDKRGGFRVSCTGEAADGSVTLSINGSPAAGAHCTLEGTSTLSIGFAASGRREILSIRMYKR